MLNIIVKIRSNKNNFTIQKLKKKKRIEAQEVPFCGWERGI